VDRFGRAGRSFFVAAGSRRRSSNPLAIDQAKQTYVTLPFDHPLTDGEVKEIQIQHSAIAAVQTIDLHDFRPDWYHTDNGFTSHHAMDVLRPQH
jgi:hypothetical protein